MTEGLEASPMASVYLIWSLKIWSPRPRVMEYWENCFTCCRIIQLRAETGPNFWLLFNLCSQPKGEWHLGLRSILSVHWLVHMPVISVNTHRLGRKYAFNKFLSWPQSCSQQRGKHFCVVENYRIHHKQGKKNTVNTSWVSELKTPRLADVSPSTRRPCLTPFLLHCSQASSCLCICRPRHYLDPHPSTAVLGRPPALCHWMSPKEHPLKGGAGILIWGESGLGYPTRVQPCDLTFPSQSSGPK